MRHIHGLFRVFCLLSVLAALSGCTTFSGAPRLPFDPDHAIVRTEAQKALDDLAKLQEAGDVRERDAAVIVLIASIDLRYMEFKQQFLAQRQHIGSIADALTLAMTVAGSLTPSAGVKNNYLQGIALVKGSADNYDKNYLLSQTVHALVAQMDANRKVRLEAIYTRMGQGMQDYPAIAAYNDVLDYYHSGTVLGAILGIQADAKQKENKAAEDLGRIQEKRRGSRAQPPKD